MPSPATPPTPVLRPTLDEVYVQELDFVWRLARRLGVPSADLEDVAQDVFLVVQRRLDDFDSARPIRAWLAGITWRLVSERRRKASARHERPGAEVDHFPSRTDGEAGVARYRARDLLLAGLDRLSPEQRDAFVLHDIEGYTAPEIAEMVSTPLNTLYSRIRLARKNLAQAIRALRGEL